MPAPFDKYKVPAAAKKWLSKYPVQHEKYEEEFIYLDELEQRISTYHKKYRQSDRYREAQNQFGVLGDYDDVDKVYPVLGEGTESKPYGRGNLLNPAHYSNAQFMTQSRIYVQNDKITPRHLQRNAGTVGNMMSLPPETESLFRFWNFWHMFGAVFVITVGKEWLIFSSHDTHHFFLWFLTTGWLGGVFADWFLWWKALRGQEFYDQRFFPLQENVDNLFALLDRLEKKPDLGIITMKYHGYIDELRQRLVTRRVMDKVAAKAQEVQEKLETKLRGESMEAGKPQKQWVADAMSETTAFFETDAEKAKYTQNSLKEFLAGNAKLGVSVNSSKVVETKYATARTTKEKKWFEENRKSGTLPWSFATDAEKKAAKLSNAEVKKVYEDMVADLSSKYHKFA